jgi:hypothetical protein
VCVQNFGLVAKDIVPKREDVGLGSTVFFPQGHYKGNAEYNRADGTHWHLGVIDHVYQDASGETRYDGHHQKGADDGKWVTYKDYNHRFAGLRAADLRVAPNVMDMLA